MEIIDIIIKKLHHNLLSEEEELFFQEWIKHSQDNLDLFTNLKKLKNKSEVVDQFETIIPELAWQKVVSKYENHIQRKQKQRLIKKIMKYAAVFVGLFFLGYAFNVYLSKKAAISIPSNEITLQSDNGDIQILSSNSVYQIKDINGKVLGAKSESKLDFRGIKSVDKLIYNTIKIPYGKNFEITLSDGTIVHLNSGSTFRFPIKFINGYKRKVNIVGEGFFEVAKDKKHPFIVETSHVDITVLGTKFNVSAYPEDTFIYTTLVEGLVSVSSIANKNKEVVRLKPGDLLSYGLKKVNINKKQVDTDIYTSWIDGRIVFKKQKFQNIIKKLERHYDVKILNNYKELNKELFTASFDIESIDEVLNSFSENKNFKYRIVGKSITINKP